ncbi:MAG: hypothetical protein B6D63_04300 [Candidatus Latescibacteria bacterium 4484_7]|nr:MAG: hypothetical protein B6D63_04300 [Candidatus Latescibacteria bacterium 4484_7]RKZ07108.1 MAG: cytoplasmic protein [bacterium]
MDRRDFIKAVAGGVLASLLPFDRARSFSLSALAKSGETKLSVVKGTDTELAVRKAVELVGGMKGFVSRGDVVFVKPNMSWDRIPAQAATTNPTVVATVVRMALEAGAKKVIVADNTCNDARRSYIRSGIKDAAEKAGAKVVYMEERKFVKSDIGGEALKKWPVFKEVLEADKLINIPIAKHHGLSGVTLSMKNLMGLIGGSRNRLHQELGTSIVDLTAFFKPTLTILDAVRILKANGPQGGNLNDVVMKNTIATSRDPVSIDAFGVTLFGKRPEDFPYLKTAVRRGLGSMDFKKEGFKEIQIG